MSDLIPADLPLWHSPWWLDRVCGPENWRMLTHVDEALGWQALMPLCFRRKYGLRIIQPPPFTPRQGPLFITDSKNVEPEALHRFQKAAIESFVTQIPRLAYTRIQGQPDMPGTDVFLRHDFHSEERVTYQLGLTNSPEALFRLFRPALQRQIRKGHRLQLRENAIPVALLSRSLSLTLRRRGASTAVSTGMLVSLDKELRQRQRGVLLSAHEPGRDSPSAMVYLIWDRDVAYAWIMASRDGQPPDAFSMPWLIWQAILYAKNLGLDTFDFEGSMIPGVARFFRQFGAVAVPYPCLVRYSWPLSDSLVRSIRDLRTKIFR